MTGFSQDFNGLSYIELTNWLSSNDLSSMSYSDLLNRLVLDLPTVLQSSDFNGANISGSPTTGQTLVWNGAAWVPSSFVEPVTGFFTGSTVAIPANTWTKVPLALTASNPTGSYTGPGGFFVPATTGSYRVDVQVTGPSPFSGGASSVFECGIGPGTGTTPTIGTGTQPTPSANSPLPTLNGYAYTTLTGNTTYNLFVFSGTAMSGLNSSNVLLTRVA